MFSVTNPFSDAEDAAGKNAPTIFAYEYPRENSFANRVPILKTQVTAGTYDLGSFVAMQ